MWRQGFKNWHWVLMVLVWTHAAAFAAIPTADNPNAFTDKQFRDVVLEFNKRTMSQAYQQVGSKNAAWDAQAIELLNAMAVRFTNGMVARRFQILDTLPPEELLERGKKLVVDLKCDDPLVVYCYAVLLDQKGEKEEARPYLRQSIKGLIERKYPSYRVMFAALRLRDTYEYDPTNEDLEWAWDVFYEYARGMTAGVDPTNLDRRIIVTQLWKTFDRFPIGVRAGLYDDLKKHPNADPWVVQMVGGNYHIDAAWKARGSGWANEVTADGWKGFREHMNAARACFDEAFKLDKRLPEAPAKLIVVEMTSAGNDAPKAMRKWFDAAVELQLDYIPAYDHLMWGLRPRWSGTHEEMYELGLECLETNRFDTDVPWMYIQMVKGITEDPGGLEFLKTPGVYENLVRAFDGFIKESATDPGVNANWARSSLAAMSYRLGRYEDARRLVVEVGGGIDPMAFEGFAMPVSLAIDHIQAMCDPLAKNISMTDALAARGVNPAALKQFRLLNTKLQTPENSGGHYVRSRITQLEADETFRKGEKVSLNVNNDLSGWYPLRGEWEIDANGGLVVAGESNESAILFFNHFGDGLDFGGTVEFSPEAAESNAAAAFILAWQNDHYRFDIVILPKQQEVMLWNSKGWKKAVKAKVGASNTVQIQVADKKLSVILNGEKVLTDVEYSDMDTFKSYLGVAGTRPGIHFKDLSVTRYPKAP